MIRLYIELKYHEFAEVLDALYEAGMSPLEDLFIKLFVTMEELAPEPHSIPADADMEERLDALAAEMEMSPFHKLEVTVDEFNIIRTAIIEYLDGLDSDLARRFGGE